LWRWRLTGWRDGTTLFSQPLLPGEPGAQLKRTRQYKQESKTVHQAAGFYWAGDAAGGIGVGNNLPELRGEKLGLPHYLGVYNGRRFHMPWRAQQPDSRSTNWRQLNALVIKRTYKTALAELGKLMSFRNGQRVSPLPMPEIGFTSAAP